MISQGIFCFGVLNEKKIAALSDMRCAGRSVAQLWANRFQVFPS